MTTFQSSVLQIFQSKRNLTDLTRRTLERETGVPSIVKVGLQIMFLFWGITSNGKTNTHVRSLFSSFKPPAHRPTVICWFVIIIITIIIIIINPLNARVVGALQMILQPVFYIFPCSPLPSWTYRTPGLSIPWCCLPNSSSVCLVFFPLSLCLARWFWQDLMNGKHDHITAVCVSLRSSGGLRVAQWPPGSWHGLPRW